MLDLSINGRKLLLPAGSTAEVEHVNTLFADGIEDSFSMPQELPVEGNEITLGHVHQLALRQRALSLRGAHLGEDGAPLFPGTLQVLATTDQVVRASFSVQGLAERLSGVGLRQAVAGNPIDLDADELAGYRFHGRPTFANGGNCQFPMHRNPALYGSENPNWNPDPSDWSATASYSVNDLVTFTSTDTVEKVQVWQCIGATSAGESPATHPAKWRLTAYGIVNAWNKNEAEHYQNSTTAHYYAMVPWFYHKWVVRQALAYLGLRPAGTWWADEATHEELLPNATTLDRAFDRDTDYFFQASLTAPHAIPSLDQDTWLIPADDDTTAPNVDSSGLWDGEYFTPNAAGTWRFRARITVDRIAPGTTFGELWVVPDTDFTARGIGSKPLPPGSPRQITIEAVATFSVGDVGNPFRLHFFQKGVGQIITWGNTPGDTFSQATLTGWLETYTGIVTPDEVVLPERHVPDVDLGAYLVALADAFNFEVRPDLANGRVWLDYKQPVLDQEYTDQSHRASGTPELDHQRTITGYRLAWGAETLEDPEGVLDLVPTVISESDLDAPTTVGLYTIVRNTRAVMRSVISNGTLVWRQLGYHVPGITIGSGTSPTEVTPAVAPLHMQQVQLDGETYLVPVLDQAGTSAWYDTYGQQDSIGICSYVEHESEDGDVPDVPTARTWRIGWSGTDLLGINHLWNDEDEDTPGFSQNYWGRWAQALVNAEPVTWDLIVDIPFILGHQWRRVIHIHSQHYLIERLPRQHGQGQDRFLSEGAYLYRLRP